MMASGGAIDPQAWQGEPAVGEIGEFGLIERFRKRLEGISDKGRRGVPGRQEEPPDQARGRDLPEPRDAGPSPARPGGGPPVARGFSGIGDDAAILSPEPGWDLLLTCDTLIEGRHFQRQWLAPHEVGARAAAVNLSDIAAMGGLPVGALLSLGLPPTLPAPALESIFDGLVDGLAAHDARLLGGNISAAAELVVDVTLIGRVEQGTALRRDGARPGDVLFVTGSPGRAGAALAGLAAGPGVWAKLARRLASDHAEGEGQVRSRPEREVQVRAPRQPRTPRVDDHELPPRVLCLLDRR